MLSEARKREKVAAAVSALSFAANAAQSPQAFVKTGSEAAPGTALMQRWTRKRSEAERNLDAGPVAYAARNRKKKTFKEFVEEAKSHDEVMKTMSKNWNRNNPGSNFNVQFRPSDDGKKDHIYLGLIDVEKGKRRAGKGTRFVKGITKYADKHKLPVSVKPVPEKGYEDKLDKFYRGHGFEDNKTKEIAPHPMIRKPKENK